MWKKEATSLSGLPWHNRRAVNFRLDTMTCNLCTEATFSICDECGITHLCESHIETLCTVHTRDDSNPVLQALADYSLSAPNMNLREMSAVAMLVCIGSESKSDVDGIAPLRFKANFPEWDGGSLWNTIASFSKPIINYKRFKYSASGSDVDIDHLFEFTELQKDVNLGKYQHDLSFCF